MLRLCAETNAENLSGLHNPLYALPAYPLYRLGKKLPCAVSLRSSTVPLKRPHGLNAPPEPWYDTNLA